MGDWGRDVIHWNYFYYWGRALGAAYASIFYDRIRIVYPLLLPVVVLNDCDKRAWLWMAEILHPCSSIGGFVGACGSHDRCRETHHLDELFVKWKQSRKGNDHYLCYEWIESEEQIGAVMNGKVLYAVSVGIDAVREGNQVTYTKQGKYFLEKQKSDFTEQVKRVQTLLTEQG